MKTSTIASQNKRLFSTKQIVILGLFSALSYVLMLFRLPYKHLGFLDIEFSDIPAVIAALQYGPLSGVFVELIKNLVKALTATSTSGVGELANFLISSAFIIPVGFLYQLKNKKNLNKTVKKTKSWNALYMVFIFSIGTISFATMGALLNYFVMLPLYANIMGMDAIINMAAANVPSIKDVAGLVLIGITPFNILKGIAMSAIGYYTYRLLRGRIL